MMSRHLKSKSRVELLSQMTQERRQSVLDTLTAITGRAEHDPPAGGWVGRKMGMKDTLVLSLEGRVVAAMTVQLMPMLDPYFIDELNVEKPEDQAAIFETIWRRAEGVLMAQGFDEYQFAISEEQPNKRWVRFASRDPETEPVLQVFRRSL